LEVFISWSGHASKAVAEALRDWLRNVIQAVRPWMSTSDIDKGARWSSEIAHHLETSRVGIICVTPDNLTAPWLLFEAGALSKTLEHTYVCPYLFGFESRDLTGPLAQFQATRAAKADTKRLVQTINRALGNNALPEENLNSAFEMWWPKLREQLDNISLDENNSDTEPQSAERELLEELIELVRRMAIPELDLRPDLAGKPESGIFSSWNKKELEGLVKALDIELPTKPRTVGGWRLRTEQWFRDVAASRPQPKLEALTVDGEVIVGLMYTLIDGDLALPRAYAEKLWPYAERAVASVTREEDAMLLLRALYIMMTSGRDLQKELRGVIFQERIPAHD
jgi:hypothetical protein